MRGLAVVDAGGRRRWEKSMNCRERSLRVLVEKWLGREDAKSARVTRFSHGTRRRWRYVCVETRRQAGAFSIVFFRHDDGSWCVFPPSNPRPALAMVGSSHARSIDGSDSEVTPAYAYA
jgi:hypothetical protein